MQSCLEWFYESCLTRRQKQWTFYSANCQLWRCRRDVLPKYERLGGSSLYFCQSVIESHIRSNSPFSDRRHNVSTMNAGKLTISPIFINAGRRVRFPRYTEAMAASQMSPTVCRVADPIAVAGPCSGDYRCRLGLKLSPVTDRLTDCFPGQRKSARQSLSRQRVMDNALVDAVGKDILPTQWRR